MSRKTFLYIRVSTLDQQNGAESQARDSENGAHEITSQSMKLLLIKEFRLKAKKPWCYNQFQTEIITLNRDWS